MNVQPEVKRGNRAVKCRSLPKNKPSSKVSAKFNGVWIPASLWNRKDVTWFQKCLLAEIASLGECFASNDYLASAMGTTASRIGKELSALRKLRLILDWGFDGRRRQITVAREVHPNPFGQPLPQGKGSHYLEVNIDTKEILESEESEETSEVSDVVFSPAFRMNPETKTQQLRKIHPPSDFPSQREFNQFITAENLEGIEKRKNDLYIEYCKNKWHHWSRKNNCWRPIADWQAYTLSLDQKIVSASISKTYT